MTLSVLIVNWNRREDLSRLLDDLRRQTRRPDQVVIVDNGSNDGAPDMIAQQHPEVELIRLPENLGLSTGRNIGLVQCRCDLIAVLDNDLRVLDTAFISKVIGSAAAHPDCGIISFFCVTGLWSRPAVGLHPPPLTMTELIQMAERSQTPVRPRVFYDWFLLGGACVIRRSVFSAIGFFDGTFRYGGEEWDFAYRCHAAGIRLLRDENLWVIHVRSPEARSTTASYLILENMIVAQCRYLPLPDLWAFLGLQSAKSLADSIRSGSLAALRDMVKRLRSKWRDQVRDRRHPVNRATMRLVYELRLRRHPEYEVARRARPTWLAFYVTRAWYHTGGQPSEQPRYVLMP